MSERTSPSVKVAMIDELADKNIFFTSNGEHMNQIMKPFVKHARWPVRCFAYLLVLIAISLLPQRAFAISQTFCATTLHVLPESETAGDTAHVVDLLDTTACSSACTIGSSGLRRAYIEFTDKDLYAAALTATTAGGTWDVSFQYGTGVDSKGGSTHNYYACRVLSIWKP
jgi:hypothetical protein